MILPLRQLNFLKEFWTDPCDAPFTVYAKAFFPAALLLLISWFTPNLENIFFNATKPTKALAKRRSGRKGRNGSKSYRSGSRWSRLNPFAFDQDEFIGKAIGAETNFQQRAIGGLEFRLWLIYGIIERIGFYIFVINTVADFFFNWMSLAERSEFCQAQRNMIVVREAENDLHLANPNGYGLYFPFVLKQRGLHSSLNSVAVPAGQWVTMSIGVDVRARQEGQSYNFRMIIYDGQGVFAEAEASSLTGSAQHAAAELKVRGPRVIYVRAVTDATVIYSGNLVAHGIPRVTG